MGGFVHEARVAVFAISESGMRKDEMPNGAVIATDGTGVRFNHDCSSFPNRKPTMHRTDI